MGIPARKKRISFLAFRLVTRDAVALANELKTAASFREMRETRDKMPFGTQDWLHESHDLGWTFG